MDLQLQLLEVLLFFVLVEEALDPGLELRLQLRQVLTRDAGFVLLLIYGKVGFAFSMSVDGRQFFWVFVVVK